MIDWILSYTFVLFLFIDPDKWRNFFQDRFGHLGSVAYVTGQLFFACRLFVDVNFADIGVNAVAKDNGELLMALAEKRYIAKMLHVGVVPVSVLGENALLFMRDVMRPCVFVLVRGHSRGRRVG